MKSTLTFTTLRMPGANLGPENPLPDIRRSTDVHAALQFDQSISDAESRYFNYGKIMSILPYRLQDQYDRNKQMRDYPCVVLENDYLKAVFFPQYGGKLWSLYDKVRGRPLLHENPVFQPANLALRNAWTSGGVEWNIGMTGHTPYTLSPLFVATTELPDGTPVLRMYEWERIRQVSYQIDAYLPAGSRYLLIRIRLRNTTNKEVPIYWWSNMAVDETPDTRVLVHADTAFHFGYTRIVSKQTLPVGDGIDRSYTTRVPRSMDLFFNIPEGQRRWIAALGGDGEGLVQTSTDLLRGRKLFLWGTGPGGKRWQSYLAQPGHAYIEIQAGLAATQMEHLPMPAGALWEWLEAYGGMTADPAKVHGDWKDGYLAVDRQLEQDLPRDWLDAELGRLTTTLDHSVKARAFGSGWAALELLRRGQGDTVFAGEQAVYPQTSITADQEPWVELLQTGTLPCPATVAESPAAYLTQVEWLPLLDTAIQSGRSNDWHAWLQRGIMHEAVGQSDLARQDLERSLACQPNGWAMRNLAMLDARAGNLDTATAGLLRAFTLLPIQPLAIECMQLLAENNQFAEADTFYDQLPANMQNNGRLRIGKIQAAIELGHDDWARDALLSSDLVVSDIREGEILLSDLWLRLHSKQVSAETGETDPEALKKLTLERFPIPDQLDFRMKT